nr:Chain D, MTA9 [Paramecium tetraurelia strain d4-2]7F4S_E Chain E, MTA9 [Paramecium tetraurelia strain d4-2]7F4S_F Chain F, MTA9 [Paramecium tetraurelia strain d4-2]
DKVTCDNLEVLLQWKGSINCQSYETDQKKIVVLKKILGTDLSQYAKGVQGIFIDNLFKKDLKNLDISKKLISNGILFIWSDKSLINEILETMENKGFTYIENLVVVQLSLEQALEELNKHMKIEQTEDAVLDNLDFLQQKVQVKDLILHRPSKVLNQSKQVLIMFRKFDEQKSQLELRHQRTPDVLFDIVNNGKSCLKTKEYIYQTIETLLPKSQLMEIFAQKDQPRKGWISVCENK